MAIMALVLISLLVPGAARASNQEIYSLSGYEVWFTPTVGSFVGTASGADGAPAGWQAAIEHSVVISPTGTISGGWATMYRTDGVQVGGYFTGGSIELVNDGAGCTAETHVVHGTLGNVWRSNSPAVTTGELEGTLVHYRAWIFGQCITYSASVTATITLQAQ